MWTLFPIVCFCSKVQTWDPRTETIENEEIEVDGEIQDICTVSNDNNLLLTGKWSVP